jgi:hypothetical protein
MPNRGRSTDAIDPVGDSPQERSFIRGGSMSAPDSIETPAQVAVPPRDDSVLPPPAPAEIGGRDGLEPTRYGDWEKNGRCIDF